MIRQHRLSGEGKSRIETLDYAKIQTHLAIPSCGTDDHTYDNLPAVNANSSGPQHTIPSPRPPLGRPIVGNHVLPMPRRPAAAVFPPEMEKVRSSLAARQALYCDTEFPADDRALYFSRAPTEAIEWKRPHEILRDRKSKERPRLFVTTSQNFDLVQGELGDCWVVAALASIAEVPELVRRIVPMGQTFDSPWYAGMFLFRFWRFGKLVDVLVDDLLPTHKNQLLFVHSRRENEFWGALLEKAYAKVVGSYEALKAGVLRDALTDFTGGVTECYSLDKPGALPPKIVNIIFKAFERQSLVGAGIKDRQVTGTPRMEHGRVMPNGLISGHAYTLTDIRRIRMNGLNGVSAEVTLVRVRNPWGKRVAWNGPWSDSSLEWRNVREADRQATGIVMRDEGEFWMTWQDFVNEFDVLDLCHLPEGTLTEAPPADLQVPQWRGFEFSGRWRRAVSSGGRPFCRLSHWTNPQVLVRLPDPDEDEEHLGTMIVCLMQKDTRRLRHLGAQLLAVGFAIYRFLPDYELPLPKSYFDTHNYVASCDYFINSRDVVKRFHLEPGEYVIIPSTYEVSQEGDFLLRLFVESSRATAHMVEEKTTLPASTTHLIKTDPDLDKQKERFRSLFYTIAGESMSLDAFQLHRLFRQVGDRENTYVSGLNIAACKALITMVDDPDNEDGGTLKMSFRDMLNIWNQIYTWRLVFHKYDAEGKGSIDVCQLRSVLSDNGYRTSPEVIYRMIHRYGDLNRRMSFSDYVCIMCSLAKIYTGYRSQQRDGKISLSLDQLLEISLST